MRCPACGAEVVQQAVYCHQCGHRLDSSGPGFATDRPPEDEPAPRLSAGGCPPRTGRRHEQLETEPERELWRGGYSSKAMAGGWAISGAISLLLLVAGVLWIPRTAVWWLILLLLMILPWLYHFAVLCYRRMSVRYLLTTQRFIHERGILRRVTDRIEVLDMDDITFEQGLLERLMGVGTIRIASHDQSNPQLELPGIENVKQVATLFDDARLAERRRRGLHVEQI